VKTYIFVLHAIIQIIWSFKKSSTSACIYFSSQNSLAHYMSSMTIQGQSSVSVYKSLYCTNSLKLLHIQTQALTCAISLMFTSTQFKINISLKIISVSCSNYL